MIIFGIDPGTAITGYGVVAFHGNSVRWVDSGIIRVKKNASLAEKLKIIYDCLCEKLREHCPACVCVEEAFYAKNVHTTLLLGHARGVALLAAENAGALVEEYSPRVIKKSVVGNGGATKLQVEYMVKMMLSPPGDHVQPDACDALAVALCGFIHYKAHKMAKTYG